MKQYWLDVAQARKLKSLSCQEMDKPQEVKQPIMLELGIYKYHQMTHIKDLAEE